MADVTQVLITMDAQLHRLRTRVDDLEQQLRPQHGV